MISSISAQDTNLLTSSSIFQNTSVSSTNKQEEEKKEEENAATATSADGDTLEISAAGTNYVQKTYTGTSKSSGVTQDEGYSSATAQTVANAAASMGINEYTAAVEEASADASTAGASSSSSSSSTSNLSQYSEAELKEMLEDGEITQSEYNAEIASRQTTGTEEEEEESGIQAASATEKSDT